MGVVIAVILYKTVIEISNRNYFGCPTSIDLGGGVSSEILQNVRYLLFCRLPFVTFYNSKDRRIQTVNVPSLGQGNKPSHLCFLSVLRKADNCPFLKHFVININLFRLLKEIIFSFSFMEGLLPISLNFILITFQSVTQNNFILWQICH